jgi:hypothetical protein
MRIGQSFGLPIWIDGWMQGSIEYNITSILWILTVDDWWSVLELDLLC